MTSVMIPSSVTNIGAGAFLRCTNLTAITVDTNNPAYSSVDGVLFNKRQTSLIECPEDSVGNYAIPNGVTTIGAAAFSGCANLTSITIPDTVTSIEEGWVGVVAITIWNWTAFYQCTSLTNVTIGTSITDIPDMAFAGCTSQHRGLGVLGVHQLDRSLFQGQRTELCQFGSV